MTKLSQGLYDRLILNAELAEINHLIDEGRATVQTPSFVENREYLLTELMNRLPELLDEISLSKDSSSDKNQAEIKLISTLLKNARIEEKAELETNFIAQPPQVLRSIHEPNMPGIFPITGLRTPWLFSSSRSEPALLHELIAELQAVDTVDILVSFMALLRSCVYF